MNLFLRIFSLLCVLSFAFSCQSVPQIAASPEGPLAAESRNSADLAYELAGKDWCSNDEAFSMVLLLARGEDRYTNFDQRLAALNERGLVASCWALDSAEPVTKGTLAYMLYGALDIEGGFFMRLIPSRRYAYREAVYLGFMERGSDLEPLTGPEVVGIMGRAVRMQEMQDGDCPTCR